MKTSYNNISNWKPLISIYTFLSLVLVACGGAPDALPVYGERYLNEQGDTVFHQIGDFSLVNQDSQVISPQTVEGKVYVADFFFTNCPSICPAMTGQKLRVYEALKDQQDFMMISHTVDPERDSVAALKEFAENIGVTAERWHFATGDEAYIHNLGIKSYLLPAQADPEAPGGFLHSDRLVLIDRKGRIRGMYSGTSKERVDQLIKDVRVLLAEAK